MTEAIVNYQPHELGDPWAVAFPLDEDARVTVDGFTTLLPAGAVLVWTGDSLDWYPASHFVRSIVLAMGAIPQTTQKGGTRIWSAPCTK